MAESGRLAAQAVSTRPVQGQYRERVAELIKLKAEGEEIELPEPSRRSGPRS